MPGSNVYDPLDLARLDKFLLRPPQQEFLTGVEDVYGVALDRTLQENLLHVVEHRDDATVEAIHPLNLSLRGRASLLSKGFARTLQADLARHLPLVLATCRLSARLRGDLE